MSGKYEQRLRRLEQKQSQALQMKKAWLPKWLTDAWSEDYGLPFDSEERGLDSLRQIQKLKKEQPRPETVVSLKESQAPQTPTGEPQAPLQELEPEPGPSAIEWK